MVCAWAVWLSPQHVYAQTPVSVHVESGAAEAKPIPADFAGLSFESSNLSPDKNGQWLFSAENKPLIALFRAIGIRNLRVGGGTADGPQFRIPGQTDIDHLFAFARAADVKVIYTVRLLNGNIEQDAAIAKYIQAHYASQLVCFQIGNEPDWHSFHTAPDHPRDPRIVETLPGTPGSAYPSFLATWRQFATAIRAAAPGAVLTGPDTGSNYPVPGTKDTDFDGQSWTERFAHDEKGKLIFVTHHDYPGQSAEGVSVDKAVDSMLSQNWVMQRYVPLWEHVLAPVQRQGTTYRMTEANDHTGGVDGASNAFVSALWALDYLHWHAAHHAAGVNFHNKSWIFTDTIFRRPDGTYGFNPKAYAFRAFDLGSEGSTVPATVHSDARVNITAYAVRGKEAFLVTLINKEHGKNAHDADVSIDAAGIHGTVMVMDLKSPGGNLTARDGVTLGDSEIAPSGWNGHWTERGVCKDGKATVHVPAGSAAVVRLMLRARSK